MAAHEPKLMISSVRSKAYRYVLVPELIVVLISIILLIIKGAAVALAVFAGGTIWTIANWLVANRLFSNVSPRAANKIVVNFYFAMASKLLLTLVLFIALIKLLPLSLGYLLFGYLLTQAIFWVMVIKK